MVTPDEGGMRKLINRWPEDLVIAPIPGRSPTFGWTLAVGGGYFMESDNPDSDSAPSAVGGFAWFAENGSYAYGGGANLHLDDDRFRVKAGAAYADLRYRYYGIGDANDLGISIDILQNGPTYFATGSWRAWRKLYIGLGYLGGDVDTSVRLAAEDPGEFFDPSLNVKIGGIMMPIEWDSRDHEQFPTSGWLVTGRSVLYRKDAGSDFDAETFMLAANSYHSVRDRDVIALRAYARTTSGDAPFFLLSTFGGSKDLRGYPSGRYRDRMMYALQGEYRWQINEKWIATGFAGFGEVADNAKEFGSDFLPAAGVGARFVLSQKHRVSLSLDYAIGKHGSEFYVGVGEAF
jgi:outer membrane protein assembly factor BamA